MHCFRSFQPHLSVIRPWLLTVQYRIWPASCRCNLALGPHPRFLTSCPWACLRKPKQEPPWEPAHYSRMCKGVNTLWVTPWPNKGGGEILRWRMHPSVFPWIDSAEIFMQLSRQSPRVEQPVTYSHDQVIKDLGTASPSFLPLSLSLIPSLDQIPNLYWSQALLSGRPSLRRNWLKTFK